MDRRTWLRNKLASPAMLQFMPIDRMVQGESMLNANMERPFLVYHFGNKTNEDLYEDPDFLLPSRQFLSIYLHDVPADYTRIDGMEVAVIHSLNGKNSAENQIITTRYLETSRDLDDQTQGTIMRYVRFQLIMAG